MSFFPPFFHSTLIIFGGLGIAALLTRFAYALSDRIAQAPWLDLFVSLFTWIAWVAGARPSDILPEQSLPPDI
jgi:hypothetical protein